MNGDAPVFVDTNVLVYAYDTAEPLRRSIAQHALSELMIANRLCLSTQVLQEFYVTMTRKIETPFEPDATALLGIP